MKRCFKCGETKPLMCFYKDARMADGRLNKCKKCAKRDATANREKRIGHYLAYDRQRFQEQPQRKAAARSRRTDPVKRRAHSAISNAIRDGRLIKQPCEVCGVSKTEAHHANYQAPLAVRWLCFRHHRELHGQRHFSKTSTT